MIKFKIFIILLFCGLNLTFSFAQQINESLKSATNYLELKTKPCK